MSDSAEAVLELILGGERFRLRALDAAHPRLLEVAEIVNKRLKELVEGGAALTLQRASLTAAFQFAYELKEMQDRVELTGEERSSLAKRIEGIIASIDRGLQEAGS